MEVNTELLTSLVFRYSIPDALWKRRKSIKLKRNTNKAQQRNKNIHKIEGL